MSCKLPYQPSRWARAISAPFDLALVSSEVGRRAHTCRSAPVVGRGADLGVCGAGGARGSKHMAPIDGYWLERQTDAVRLSLLQHRWGNAWQAVHFGERHVGSDHEWRCNYCGARMVDLKGFVWHVVSSKKHRNAVHWSTGITPEQQVDADAWLTGWPCPAGVALPAGYSLSPTLTTYAATSDFRAAAEGWPAGAAATAGWQSALGASAAGCDPAAEAGRASTRASAAGRGLAPTSPAWSPRTSGAEASAPWRPPPPPPLAPGPPKATPAQVAAGLLAWRPENAAATMAIWYSGPPTPREPDDITRLVAEGTGGAPQCHCSLTRWWATRDAEIARGMPEPDRFVCTRCGVVASTPPPDDDY